MKGKKKIKMISWMIVLWFVLGLICFITGGILFGIKVASETALILIIGLGIVSWVFGLIMWRRMKNNESRVGISYLS